MNQKKSRRISVWGATGSIGRQTLEVMASFPDEWTVELLTARRSGRELLTAARQWRAERAVLTDEETAASWHGKFADAGIELLAGREGLLQAAKESRARVVVNALAGSVGLEATMRALQAGSHIALANKEVLVMAGELVMNYARERDLAILPVDSEHSALFQCLRGEKAAQVSRLVLTASGGPFRRHTADQLQHVTLKQALAHPNWSMGPKVSIDSATMVNKGLEVIEARWLFGAAPDMISVVIHPQSIVHSMVEYADGSVKAQMSMPDMRLPISYALFYPERRAPAYGSMDFSRAFSLDFYPPDLQRFSGLAMAFEALETGGTAPAVFNAADEAAVDLFVQGRIGFMDIPRLIREALDSHQSTGDPNLETILAVDRQVRHHIMTTFSKE